MVYGAGRVCTSESGRGTGRRGREAGAKFGRREGDGGGRKEGAF
jgi:hypothetical protein